jgi:DinB superfamily
MNQMMDRPERLAALDYLRRKGTDAPVSKLVSGLRSTFRRLEEALDRLPESLRTQRPSAASWSVHEIVDHLVESHRPAVAELRALCAGVSPGGGPIPARLTSSNALERPWGQLIDDLKRVHAEVLDLIVATGDAPVVGASAPFVMVVKVSGATGSEVLEWVEALDWKAYAQALRVHTHEHLAQVERAVSALRSDERNCETDGA